MLVLVSHGFFFTGRVDGIGRVGVNLFFFISGILVFQSLARMAAIPAWEKTGKFWMRRFRRLYPALLAYVLAMCPVAYLAQNLRDLPPNHDFGSYLSTTPWVLAYLVNYRIASAPMALGHLWSLACEMQFYLLSPLIVWLAGRYGIRKMIVFTIVLIMLTSLGLLQPILKARFPVVGEWKYHFEFAVWPMMAGFYCEFQGEWLKRFPKVLLETAYWLGIVASLFGFVSMLAGKDAKNIVIASGALLLGTCYVSYLSGRCFSRRTGTALKWLGERTYSIYLWQQPLTICGFLPYFLHPVGAVMATGFGAVWFNIFEQPFISKSRGKDISELTGRPVAKHTHQFQ